MNFTISFDDFLVRYFYRFSSDHCHVIMRIVHESLAVRTGCMGPTSWVYRSEQSYNSRTSRIADGIPVCQYVEPLSEQAVRELDVCPILIQ